MSNRIFNFDNLDPAVFDIPPVDVRAAIVKAYVAKFGTAPAEWIYDEPTLSWRLVPCRNTTTPKRT